MVATPVHGRSGRGNLFSTPAHIFSDSVNGVSTEVKTVAVFADGLETVAKTHLFAADGHSIHPDGIAAAAPAGLPTCNAHTGNDNGFSGNFPGDQQFVGPLE